MHPRPNRRQEVLNAWQQLQQHTHKNAELYCKEWGITTCLPDWVCAPSSQEGAKAQRGNQTAERLRVGVGFRGLKPTVREPGAGLEVEGCFLSGQSFSEYKLGHISPLLKNIPWPSIGYREMAMFPTVVQALYHVTHPQVFFACLPAPSCTPPIAVEGGYTTARWR